MVVFITGCFFAALLLITTPASAVGLGELSSSSFLGQPLKATIDIRVGPDNLGIDELVVSQLNNQQASDIGIELAGYYQNYQPILVDDNGKLVIELSSRKPVNEPFLNFVIALTWYTGKVYREYTVLLDPVVISAQVIPRSKDSISVSDKRPTISGRVASKAVIEGESYRVQIGDSLSKIASKLVKGTNRKRLPVMKWLVDENPRAFVKGDMNRLKAGALLALPDDNDLNVAALNASEPQSKPRSEPGTKAASSTATKPIKTKPVERESPAVSAKAEEVEQAASAPKPIERLSIVTPNTSKTGAKGAASSESELVDQLQNQLAATNEMVERLNRDNQAMRDRLLAIEKSSYVDSLERLVLLKEEEINTLQTQLDQRKQEQSNDSQAVEVKQAELAEPAASTEGTQRYGLMALLMVSLLGALYFFYRWRFVDRLPDASVTNDVVDEKSLLNELDKIIASRSNVEATDSDLQGDHASATDVISETQSAFSTIGKSGVDNSKRRDDNVVKQSIQEKTNDYNPPKIDEQDQSHHEELDQRISEAIDAANRGAFDIAEALIYAEQAEQARIGNEGRTDSRLDVALQYVEKLRKNMGK